jgi:hypothetical protein
MATETTQKQLEGPRWAVTIRVACDARSRIKAAAQKWGVTPTKAAARLLQIGLDAEAETWDPNRELKALGLTLAAVADRLDHLDRLCEAAARVWPRSAIKSAIVLTSKLKVAGDAADALRQLDAAVKQAIEETLK